MKDKLIEVLDKYLLFKRYRPEVRDILIDEILELFFQPEEIIELNKRERMTASEE